MSRCRQRAEHRDGCKQWLRAHLTWSWDSLATASPDEATCQSYLSIPFSIRPVAGRRDMENWKLERTRTEVCGPIRHSRPIPSKRGFFAYMRFRGLVHCDLAPTDDDTSVLSMIGDLKAALIPPCKDPEFEFECEVLLDQVEALPRCPSDPRSTAPTYDTFVLLAACPTHATILCKE